MNKGKPQRFKVPTQQNILTIGLLLRGKRLDLLYLACMYNSIAGLWELCKLCTLNKSYWTLNVQIMAPGDIDACNIICFLYHKHSCNPTNGVANMVLSEKSFTLITIPPDLVTWDQHHIVSVYWKLFLECCCIHHQRPRFAVTVFTTPKMGVNYLLPRENLVITIYL